MDKNTIELRKPTGVALTPDEELDKFERVLELMTEHAMPVRKALRLVGYGAAKFFEYLNGTDLTKMQLKSASIQLKGTLIQLTDEYIQLMKEERQKQYARAREIMIDLLVDETIEIADDATNDTYDIELDGGIVVTKTDIEVIQRSRERIQARQWYAAKCMSRKYGNKVEQTLVGDAEKPITVISLGGGIKPPDDE